MTQRFEIGERVHWHEVKDGDLVLTVTAKGAHEAGYLLLRPVPQEKPAVRYVTGLNGYFCDCAYIRVTGDEVVTVEKNGTERRSSSSAKGVQESIDGGFWKEITEAEAKALLNHPNIASLTTELADKKKSLADSAARVATLEQENEKLKAEAESLRPYKREHDEREAAVKEITENLMALMSQGSLPARK